MDDPDELSEERKPDPTYLASMLSPADPMNLKRAFDMLIDGLIEKTDGDILDWGTLEMETQRILNPETGQELIYFFAMIRAIEVNP